LEYGTGIWDRMRKFLLGLYSRRRRHDARETLVNNVERNTVCDQGMNYKHILSFR
jgi:hypothetical protein